MPNRTPKQAREFIAELHLRVRRVRNRDNPYRLIYERMEELIRGWQGERYTEEQMLAGLSQAEQKAYDIAERILRDA